MKVMVEQIKGKLISKAKLKPSIFLVTIKAFKPATIEPMAATGPLF